MSISKILDQYRGGALSAAEVKQMLRQMHDDKERISLSQGQQGLWVLQNTFPDTTAYNVPVGFKLGRVDVDKFKQACECLLEQHPLLQVVFEQDKGIPYQKVAGVDSLVFSHERFAAKSDDAVLELLRVKVNQPFELDKAVMRVHLVEVSADETIVLMVLHHIVFDGVSVKVMMTSLLDAYGALLKGKLPSKAAFQPNYFDYVKYEQEMMAGEEGASRLAYWRETLSGTLPTLALPTDKPRTEQYNRFAGKVYSSIVDEAAGNCATQLATKQSCYTSTVFLAVFNALLNKFTGEEDFVVGMPGQSARR